MKTTPFEQDQREFEDYSKKMHELVAKLRDPDSVKEEFRIALSKSKDKGWSILQLQGYLQSKLEDLSNSLRRQTEMHNYDSLRAYRTAEIIKHHDDMRSSYQGLFESCNTYYERQQALYWDLKKAKIHAEVKAMNISQIQQNLNYWHKMKKHSFHQRTAELYINECQMALDNQMSID